MADYTGNEGGSSGKTWNWQEAEARRKEQMKEVTDRLEAGVKEYMATDTQFKKVLETMSKFHHYSANNVLLIAMQMPSATHVASYTNWKTKFKRQVMKGQKGLSIISPAPYKKKIDREVTNPRTGKPVLDAQGNVKHEEVEVTVPKFRVVKVFDISQTPGEPLPELDVPELAGSTENFELFMDAVRAVSPAPLRFDKIDSGAKGYYDNEKKEIVIKKGMSGAQTMKTAVHELAHARLHDRDAMKAAGIEKDQRAKELEAEGTAYVVLSHYRLDTSDYSIPYLASWSGSQDTKALCDCLDTIRRTASGIIDEVDAFMAERMKERDVDRYTIYQIREGSPAEEYCFMDMDFVRGHGYVIRPEYYDQVYQADLKPEETLESLYTKFNVDRPEDFQGRSLSVSDIVVLHRSGEDHAYYVDPFGTPEVPEFLHPELIPDQEQQNQSQQEDSEPVTTFCVAECVDFPVMGAFYEDLSLAQAAEVYQKMPDSLMHGGKGIICKVQEGDDLAALYTLVAGGTVQENIVEMAKNVREAAAIKAAITEAKILFPGQTVAQEMSVEHSVVDSPAMQNTAAEFSSTHNPATRIVATSEQPAEYNTAVHEHHEHSTASAKTPAAKEGQPGRKESVLAALRKHQKSIRENPENSGRDDRSHTTQRKKGDLAI